MNDYFIQYVSEDECAPAYVMRVNAEHRLWKSLALLLRFHVQTPVPSVIRSVSQVVVSKGIVTLFR